MKKADIERRARAVLADQMGYPQDKILDDSSVAESGMDSLDMVEIVMEIEEEFDVLLEDEDAAKCSTFAEFVALIETSDPH